jgi:hypothetical protein
MQQFGTALVRRMRLRQLRAGAVLRRVPLLGLVACFAFLPAASAATADRVQVGRPGQNRTAGHPLALFVGVAVLPDYRAVGRFDGDSRSWEGPEYRAASLESRKATIDWQVTFDDAGSVAAMAKKALGSASWPVAERPRARIPHLVGKRNVGSIPAVALLTKAPGENNAQYESVVAFPLCRGVLVAAKFALTSPGSDYAGGPSEPFLVKGNVPAGQWNHDRAVEALRQVTLEGYLPIGRLTARADGRSVRGTVRDCRGHPMAGIQLRLLRGSATVARARAAADGSYRLAAPGAGTHTVSVSQTVTGKGGSGTRRDSRSASVRVG